MKNSIYLVIVVLLLFLAVVGLWMFQGQKLLQPTTTPLSETKVTIPGDWLTYESVVHSFSFRYPQDWELSVIAEREDFLSLNLKKEDTSQGKIPLYEQEIVPLYEINITVEDNPQGLSAQDLYLSNFTAASREQAAQNLELVEYASAAGIKYPEGVAPASGPATGILLVNNQKAYRFVYSAIATEQTHEKFLPTMEQILSSLSFDIHLGV